MEYKIRQMYPNEYPYLKEFLYEAIFQKDMGNLLPKEIINKPDLKIYIETLDKNTIIVSVPKQVEKSLEHCGHGSFPDTGISMTRLPNLQFLFTKSTEERESVQK